MARAYADSPTHARGEDLTRLRDLIPGGEVVLDIGTGAGHTLAAIGPGARLAVGVDPTPEMLAVARDVLRERGVRPRLVEADAAALPFLDRIAGVVVSRLAAHHFPHVERAFAEVVRILRPGGRFCLVDNYSPQDPELDEWLDTLERLKDPTHVRSYTLERWQELMRSVGLVARVEATLQTDVLTEPWLARSAATPEAAERARSMLRDASPGARELFRIHEHGFSLLKAVIVATKT